MILKKLAVGAFIMLSIEAGAQNLTQQLTEQGFIHYKRGQYKAAADYFGQIIDMEPYNDTIRYYLIYSLYCSGSKDAALKQAQILSRKYPNEQKYKQLADQIYADIGAVATIENTNTNAKTGISKEVMFGGYQSITGDKEELLKPSYDETPRDITPPRAKTKLEEAMALMDEENYVEATRMINDILKSNKKDAEAWHQLGVIEFSQNRFENAVKNFSESIKISPKHFQSLYLRGDSYKNLGQYNKAEEDYKKAISIKKDTFAMQNLGEVLINQGKNNEAAKIYNELLSINPMSGEAKAGLAQINIAQGKMSDANDLINSALASGNSSSELHYMRALMWAESEEHLYSEAIAELDSILKDNPTNSKYLTLKAKCMVKNYDISGGMELARSIVDEEPTNADAKLVLAEALFMATSYDDAKKAIEEAERIRQIPEASLLKAKISAAIDDHSSADRYYNEYIQRAKGKAAPYFEYAQYLKSRNDIDGATKYYNKIISEFRASELAFKARQEIATLE